MNRPYVICHMMMSIEACIDCAMTAQLEGMIISDNLTTCLGLFDHPHFR